MGPDTADRSSGCHDDWDAYFGRSLLPADCRDDPVIRKISRNSRKCRMRFIDQLASMQSEPLIFVDLNWSSKNVIVRTAPVQCFHRWPSPYRAAMSLSFLSINQLRRLTLFSTSIVRLVSCCGCRRYCCADSGCSEFTSLIGGLSLSLRHSARPFYRWREHHFLMLGTAQIERCRVAGSGNPVMVEYGSGVGLNRYC